VFNDGAPTRVDRCSQVPLHEQVAARLQAAIESRDIAPGHQLGNEIKLAAYYGVSRGTMRQAIRKLVISGQLVRKRGTGTTVLPRTTTRPLRLTSLFDDLSQGDQSPQTTVLVNRVIAAPADIAVHLQLPGRQPVLHLRRVRALDGEPLAILENYLPADLLDMHSVDLTFTGLYRALRAVGVHPKVAKQRIGARTGTQEECELLAEPAESALLTMDRLTHADTGQPVEWGRHLYRPDRYAFTHTVTAP